MNKTIPITEISDRQRKNFSCGVDSLDEYFKQYAKGNHIKNIGKTFVLLDEDGLVVGYYTLSMGSVEFKTFSEEIRLKLPRYPIPIARIGRFAINKNKQGQGWGKFLMIDALRRVCEASDLVAAFGIVVDAKDQSAKAFYTKFGFISFVDSDLCLFLPLIVIRQLL